MLVITTAHIIASLISIAALLMFAVWLLKQWIGARIDKSIQHEYDKKLEDYKNSRIRREKAELVAKLFSQWIRYRGREKTILNKEDLMDYYETLNRMSLELALWIDDVEVLNDVMKRLTNRDNPKSIYEIIGQVRHLIQEGEDDFDPHNIVLWPVDEDVDNLYGEL